MRSELQELAKLLAWEESNSAEDDQRIAAQMMVVIQQRLAAPAAGQSRLYLLLPVPGLSLQMEAEILAAIPTSQSSQPWPCVRILALRPNYNVYVLSNESDVQHLVPLMVRQGPPEITVIAVNAACDDTATQAELEVLLSAALQKELPVDDVFGLHFDSADLVELF